jgi:3-phenylpropionate/trans-cinnamate dioxygenase ferredoxin reductase subunit
VDERAERAVVVVGNGVSGFAAADRLARNGVRPLLVGPGPVADRPPLSKGALADGAPHLLADDARLDELGIDRHRGLATEFDLRARRLVLTGDGPPLEVHAEHLVLAMGLRYDPPPIPGLAGAHLNALPEGLGPLAARLAGGRRRVVVIGGGLIGVETAATLAEAGHEVAVVEMEARPLHRLHDPLPAIAQAALDELGIAFHPGFAVAGVEARPDGASVVSAVDGAPLVADVVVAATGGRQQGIPGLGDHGAPVAVGADMSVPGIEGVFVVGDGAAPVHERFGRLELPHWDTAIGTGMLAADAILGRAEPYGRLPYWWSDIGPRRIAEVGVAGAAVDWDDADGLLAGRDEAGAIVCVLVVDQPRRMRDARRLVTAAQTAGAA